MCWISVEYIGMSLFEEVLLYCASWGFAAKSMRFDNVIQGLCCFPCTLLYFHNSIRRAMGAGRMDPLANCCWAAKWNKTGPSHPELPSNWTEIPWLNHLQIFSKRGKVALSGRLFVFWGVYSFCCPWCVLAQHAEALDVSTNQQLKVHVDRLPKP